MGSVEPGPPGGCPGVSKLPAIASEEVGYFDRQGMTGVHELLFGACVYFRRVSFSTDRSLPIPQHNVANI